MTSLTAAELLQRAAREVTQIDAEQAKQLHQAGTSVFVDVRDAMELLQQGKVPGALHCSRGVLEFQLCPESPMYNPSFDRERQLVFYCAGGGRALLAAKLAAEFGYDAICMSGGYAAWQQAGGKIEAVD